jgi:hypothetical protein
VSNHLKLAPWCGKLPPPRVSPPRTFGDAQIGVQHSRSILLAAGAVRDEEHGVAVETNYLLGRQSRRTAVRSELFAASSNCACRNVPGRQSRRTVVRSELSAENSVFKSASSKCAGRTFRPMAGLSRLLSRTGTGKPYSSHSQPPNRNKLARSYADAVRSPAMAMRPNAPPQSGAHFQQGHGQFPPQYGAQSQQGHGQFPQGGNPTHPGFHPGYGNQGGGLQGHGGGRGYHANRGGYGWNRRNRGGHGGSRGRGYGGRRYGGDFGYGGRGNFNHFNSFDNGGRGNPEWAAAPDGSNLGQQGLGAGGRGVPWAAGSQRPV